MKTEVHMVLSWLLAFPYISHGEPLYVWGITNLALQYQSEVGREKINRAEGWIRSTSQLGSLV